MFNSPVHIIFMRDDAIIWDVKWSMVPRRGEIIALPQGKARIEEVVWEIRQDRPEILIYTRPLEEEGAP